MCRKVSPPRVLVAIRDPRAARVRMGDPVRGRILVLIRDLAAGQGRGRVNVPTVRAQTVRTVRDLVAHVPEGVHKVGLAAQETTARPVAQAVAREAVVRRADGTREMNAPVPMGRDARDQHWMRQALTLAEQAASEFADVPVGALLLDAKGELLATGLNRCVADHDPSAHAEIVALRGAGRKLGNHRLTGSTLYVTLEPCAMCAMALVHARVARVVYAADDPKTGAAVSVFDLLQSERHNHRISLTRGVLADEASQMLRDFFLQRRSKALHVSPIKAVSQ